VEGDEGGYDEEFPLEGLELNTSDFMAKVAVGDFRRSWEEVHAF
jgi:coatomer subunit gamma